MIILFKKEISPLVDFVEDLPHLRSTAMRSVLRLPYRDLPLGLRATASSLLLAMAFLGALLLIIPHQRLDVGTSEDLFSEGPSLSHEGPSLKKVDLPFAIAKVGVVELKLLLADDFLSELGCEEGLLGIKIPAETPRVLIDDLVTRNHPGEILSEDYPVSLAPGIAGKTRD